MKTVILAGGGTGGHLYPALALGAAIEKRDPNVRVHYVGARRGIEARVLPARNVEYTLLPIRGFQRREIWSNWRLVPSVAATFASISTLFMRLRPSLVVGTGGYASAPAGMWAVMTSVPVAVQEQNSQPGFTTRLLARWARQVHLGFPEAARMLKPGRHTEVYALGNPIEPPDPSIDAEAARARFGLSRDATVMLVVGGSQGARAMNDVLLETLRRVAARELPSPPDRFEILWATGPAHIDGIQSALSSMKLEWVRAVGYIDAMPQALAATDFALSRAGAMATAELLAWGRPMLLVPLPTAADDHQTHNARTLDAAGAAVMLEERGLTPEQLWQNVLELATNLVRRERMKRIALERARPNAARDIADHLHRLIA